MLLVFILVTYLFSFQILGFMDGHRWAQCPFFLGEIVLFFPGETFAAAIANNQNDHFQTATV